MVRTVSFTGNLGLEVEVWILRTIRILRRIMWKIIKFFVILEKYVSNVSSVIEKRFCDNTVLVRSWVCIFHQIVIDNFLKTWFLHHEIRTFVYGFNSVHIIPMWAIPVLASWVMLRKYFCTTWENFFKNCPTREKSQILHPLGKFSKKIEFCILF